MAENLQAEREARLIALQDIVRNRERELIEWEKEYAATGPYTWEPFVPELSDVSQDLVAKEVRSANPLRQWLLSGLAGLLGAVIAPQLWIRIPFVMFGIYMFVQAFLLSRARQAEVDRVIRERQAQYEEEMAAAGAAHEAEQSLRAKQHEQEEHLRARLRDAVEQDDAEIAALALEIELSNEDLPIEIAYQVEFDGIRQVTIQVNLPPLEDIPLTRSRVTKTGKFSERPMAMRDRVALYQDVCAGLALRLMHEVYRVLPFVESVNLTGMADGMSASTGHPDRYPALHLSTTRDQFLAINLDQVDPSQAFLGLAGHLATSREGQLKPLDPEHD